MPVNQNQRLTGGLIGVPPWQGIPLYTTTGVNNAGGGQVAAQWRYWPLMNSIEVVGCITMAGPTGSSGVGNPIAYPWRMPYRPAHNVIIPVQLQGNTVAPVNTPYLQLDTFGNLNMFLEEAFSGSQTALVSFQGWFPLDP